MLQLSINLLNRPVLSLRTGSPVAWVTTPIINPTRLNIEGFYVTDSVDHSQLILLYQDIRELSPQGYIIDDHDVLAQPADLVRLQNVLTMNFDLLNKPIETVSHEKIGKVNDYAVETTTMYIQKLYVGRSIWKSFTSGSLSIDRTQIAEVTNKRIVINNLLQGMPSVVPATAA
ncbi:MAG TPA: hypothetical protein VFT53_06635 [Candidatus Saccharimonadales bacterium]|nr:hypothetical protein [Candidatus Saccharimonadales bacterium]